MTITATFFDFGGVVLSSPFEAFNRYEAEHGLPRDLFRTVNATNPDTNAWAQFERSQITFDTFCDRFEEECRARGHEVDAREMLPLLQGEVRPAMVEAIRRCRAAGLVTACLTNNWVSHGDRPDDRVPTGRSEVLSLFDHIVESSKVGVRKPDRRFYEIACEIAQVHPGDVVFLDDLGVNLKPAREMGMTTIKVGDPTVAIAELEAVLGLPLH